MGEDTGIVDVAKIYSHCYSVLVDGIVCVDAFTSRVNVLLMCVCR